MAVFWSENKNIILLWSSGMIADFESVDGGSIPPRRTIFFMVHQLLASSRCAVMFFPPHVIQLCCRNLSIYGWYGPTTFTGWLIRLLYPHQSSSCSTNCDKDIGSFQIKLNLYLRGGNSTDTEFLVKIDINSSTNNFGTKTDLRRPLRYLHFEGNSLRLNKTTQQPKWLLYFELTSRIIIADLSCLTDQDDGQGVRRGSRDCKNHRLNAIRHQEERAK